MAAVKVGPGKSRNPIVSHHMMISGVATLNLKSQFAKHPHHLLATRAGLFVAQTLYGVGDRSHAAILTL